MPLAPRRLAKFDARARRRAAGAFLLFGGAGVVLMFGATVVGVRHGGAEVERWLGAGLPGPWALLASVAGFTALAFLGVPQIALVAAAVAAFGPWRGFAYAWTGNLVSCVVGFWAGRRFGARLLRDHAGERVRAFVEMVGRNGFWASLVVRLVPGPPFVVVNMAAGATPMRFTSFLAGTALGSAPKIALAAFAGNAAVRGLQGGGTGRWIALGVSVAVWIGLGLLARAWLKRREGAALTEVTPP